MFELVIDRMVTILTYYYFCIPFVYVVNLFLVLRLIIDRTVTILTCCGNVHVELVRAAYNLLQALSI